MDPLQQLPSMKSLVAFETVLRHRSFSRAAVALGISQSGVSRRIAKLETHVGTALFVRDAIGVELTEAGEKYAQTVSRAVDALMELGQLNQSWIGRDKLTIACSHGVAELWLLRRLMPLRGTFPALEIELRIYDSFTLLRSDEYDLAITFHDAPPDLKILGRLGTEDTVPVMAPSLPPLAQQKAPMILTMEGSFRGWSDWSNWLDAAGMTLPDATMRWKMGNYGLCIDAAVRGLGVAMGWTWLLHDHLAAGRLVRAHSQHFRASGTYYLTHSTHRRQRQITNSVGQWLVDSDDHSNHDKIT